MLKTVLDKWLFSGKSGYSKRKIEHPGPNENWPNLFYSIYQSDQKKRSSKNAEAVKRQQYLIQHQSNILLQKVEA